MPISNAFINYSWITKYSPIAPSNAIIQIIITPAAMQSGAIVLEHFFEMIKLSVVCSGENP